MDSCRLPLELCHTIIELCATYPVFVYVPEEHNAISEIPSYRATIIACALTCQAWLPTALRCLYRGVAVSFSPPHNQHREAWLQYVDNELGSSELPLPLRLQLITQSDKPTQLTVDGVRSDEENALDYPAISTILPELCQRSSTASGYTVSAVSWRSSICANAVQDLRFHTVRIDSFSDLIRTLAAFLSLRHLFLGGVKVNYIQDDTARVRPPQLYTFKCVLEYDILQPLIQWFITSGGFKDTLRSVSIDDIAPWMQQEDPIRQDLANWAGDISLSAATSLRSFELKSVLDGPIKLDFGTNSLLETFTINWIHPANLVDILRTIASSHFSTLRLHPVWINDPADIDKIVDALVPLLHRSSLGSVDMKVVTEGRWPDMGEDRGFESRRRKQREILKTRMARLEDILGEELIVELV